MKWLRLLFAAAREAGVELVELTNHQRALNSGALSIGSGTYGRPRVNVYPGDTSRVVIGNYCSIAGEVEFTPGGGHRTDWVTTYPMRLLAGGNRTDQDVTSKGDILVGSDVWIGRGAHILSGVTIGNGAVIGARAIVTRPVRPYAIVAGNPAREIRRRFTDSDIDRLEQIRWWDWPLDHIVAEASLLESGQLGALFAKYG